MEAEAFVPTKNRKNTVKSYFRFHIKVSINLKGHSFAFRMCIFIDALTKINWKETACDVLFEICLHFGVSIQIRKWCIGVYGRRDTSGTLRIKFFGNVRILLIAKDATFD